MRAKLVLMALAIGALSLLLFSPGGTQQTQAAGVTVDVGNDWFCDNSFDSPSMSVYCTTTIHVGDTVTWHRVMGTHDVMECGADFSKWSEADGDCMNSDWESPMLNAAGTDWSHTFDQPGEFFYACHVHWPDQKGKIVVEVAPTPPPTVKGDVDCSGDVSSVDALKVLQYVAHLPVNLGPSCPQLGTDAGGGQVAGDMNCDGVADSSDALVILRHVAQLPLGLPAGCQDLG